MKNVTSGRSFSSCYMHRAASSLRFKWKITHIYIIFITPLVKWLPSSGFHSGMFVTLTFRNNILIFLPQFKEHSEWKQPQDFFQSQKRSKVSRKDRKTVQKSKWAHRLNSAKRCDAYEGIEKCSFSSVQFDAFFLLAELTWAKWRAYRQTKTELLIQ